MSWHIIPLKFSRQNTICFEENEPIKIQCFRPFRLFKVHPIPYPIPVLKPQGHSLPQTFHHCSASSQMTLYLFSSNLIYFGQNEPIRVKFSYSWVVEKKFTKFLMSCLKPKVGFSLNFSSLFSAMKVNSSFFFFNWNFISFGQKEPIKVQNFRILTAHVRFHQTCTLIGSFCWKYI